MNAETGWPSVDSGAAVFNHATFEALAELLSETRMHPHLRALRELIDGAAAREATATHVRTIAHQLISQAGALGFEQICACSREVENTRHRGGLEKQVSALHQALQAARPTLDRLLAEAA